jgi:hypothetical protein
MPYVNGAVASYGNFIRVAIDSVTGHPFPGWAKLFASAISNASFHPRSVAQEPIAQAIEDSW